MRRKNKILPAVAVFFLSYVLLLFIWVQVKPFYGNFLAHVGAQLSAWTTGARLNEIEQDSEVANISFLYYAVTSDGSGDIILKTSISVSNYSFNVPLTFALIAGLFVIFRWAPGTILESCLILIGIHLAYIYFYCTLQIFYQLAVGHIMAPSKWIQFLLQFLWGFTDNLIIRFEPFLIAVYLWLRQTLRARAAAANAG
jgi:hypothetical protein